MNIENTRIGLPILQPIVLTTEDDDEMRIHANWGVLERLERNIMRVSLAAGLSAIGGVLAGFVPTTGGIFAGGAIGGIGNGVSTWLAWEKADQYFLEARLIEDFPKVMERTTAIDQYLDDIIARMQKLYSVGLPVDTTEPSIETKDDDDAALCSIGRKQRNCVRLMTAGGLSAAGGWLGGFAPNPAGIIGGAVLGGIGNGVSTWLAFEQANDKEIQQKALKDLPKVFKQLHASSTALIDLVECIRLLDPECLMFEEAELKPVNSEDTPSDECCLKSRYLRNFAYVNIAGWMSAAGGWVGGYWPHPGGIIIGGTLSSAANAISTWLAWEKPNDVEMEKTAIKRFPELVLKVNAISHKLNHLTNICSGIEKKPVLKEMPSEIVEL